jgi:peptide alpha-N-acetyltransferase
MNKARVLKHQNKLEDAADVMDQARTLDLQDRFVNCKAVKYFLRANKPIKAKEVARLFLVDENGEIKRTWCSSTKRENFNVPGYHENTNLYHSYHLYHSFISQENPFKSNAQTHTQMLRKLDSRFALEHRYNGGHADILVRDRSG